MKKATPQMLALNKMPDDAFYGRLNTRMSGVKFSAQGWVRIQYVQFASIIIPLTNKHWMAGANRG